MVTVLIAVLWKCKAQAQMGGDMDILKAPNFLLTGIYVLYRRYNHFHQAVIVLFWIKVGVTETR